MHAHALISKVYSALLHEGLVTVFQSFSPVLHPDHDQTIRSKLLPLQGNVESKTAGEDREGAEQMLCVG